MRCALSSEANANTGFTVRVSASLAQRLGLASLFRMGDQDGRPRELSDTLHFARPWLWMPSARRTQSSKKERINQLRPSLRSDPSIPLELAFGRCPVPGKQRHAPNLATAGPGIPFLSGTENPPQPSRPHPEARVPDQRSSRLHLRDNALNRRNRSTVPRVSRDPPKAQPAPLPRHRWHRLKRGRHIRRD